MNFQIIPTLCKDLHVYARGFFICLLSFDMYAQRGLSQKFNKQTKEPVFVVLNTNYYN